MKTRILGAAFWLMAICCFMTQDTMAQDYDASIGVRFGSPTSVSYKKFVKPSNAIELNAGVWLLGGVSVGAAYLIHKPIKEFDKLNWYYGGGASAYLGGGGVGVGVNGYLGLDYSFKDAPINLSLDWVPTVVLGSGSGFAGGAGGLSVRYILN